MGLARHGHVVLKAALAGQEPPVLEAPQRLADPEFQHRLA